MRLGSFTHFTDAQTFSKTTCCQLVQKTGVANGACLAKGPGLANGAGVAPTTTSREPVAEPNLSRQRAVEAVAGGGEAVEEGGE